MKEEEEREREVEREQEREVEREEERERGGRERFEFKRKSIQRPLCKLGASSSFYMSTFNTAYRYSIIQGQGECVPDY